MILTPSVELFATALSLVYMAITILILLNILSSYFVAFVYPEMVSSYMEFLSKFSGYLSIIYKASDFIYGYTGVPIMFPMYLDSFAFIYYNHSLVDILPLSKHGCYIVKLPVPISCEKDLFACKDPNMCLCIVRFKGKGDDIYKEFVNKIIFGKVYVYCGDGKCYSANYSIVSTPIEPKYFLLIKWNFTFENTKVLEFGGFIPTSFNPTFYNDTILREVSLYVTMINYSTFIKTKAIDMANFENNFTNLFLSLKNSKDYIDLQQYISDMEKVLDLYFKIYEDLSSKTALFFTEKSDFVTDPIVCISIPKRVFFLYSNDFSINYSFMYPAIFGFYVPSDYYKYQVGVGPFVTPKTYLDKYYIPLSFDIYMGIPVTIVSPQ